jgi:hypothetical protein
MSCFRDFLLFGVYKKNRRYLGKENRKRKKETRRNGWMMERKSKKRAIHG